MPQATTIHIVKPGETLSSIAQLYQLSVRQLVEVNQQIHNPDLIWVGEAINIPDRPQIPAGPPGPVTVFDGIHPGPGTTIADRGRYTTPSLLNNRTNRDPAIYNQVIDQFAVAYNPRHLRSQGYTYCNIFLWDVTRAMDAEIPHWLNAAGDIAVPFSHGANEININAGIDWLKSKGAAHGWTLTDAQTAQDTANIGQVAVVVWKNPIAGGHGHTAVVRPGVLSNRGPVIAQAGASNFNVGRVKDSFGTRVGLNYYIHQ